MMRIATLIASIARYDQRRCDCDCAARALSREQVSSSPASHHAYRYSSA